MTNKLVVEFSSGLASVGIFDTICDDAARFTVVVKKYNVGLKEYQVIDTGTCENEQAARTWAWELVEKNRS
jgi:hypothetical protein